MIMTPNKNLFVPMVSETDAGITRSYDIFSKLLKERIVMLYGEVNDDIAQIIISQLLYLESEDSQKDIYLYINSPGGSVTSGLAIYDTMNFISCDVNTVCIGIAASMGAFLLSSGAKGKRMCLPNSSVMVHQPSGGMQGQASDMLIQMQQMISTKEKLNQILAKNTGKDIHQIEKDTDRDHWMTAQEAKDYGLIDTIKTSHTD